MAAAMTAAERKRRQRLRDSSGVGNLTLRRVNYAKLGERFKAAKILPEWADSDRATLEFAVVEYLSAIGFEPSP